MNRYIIQNTAFLLIPLLCVAAINWLFDPYLLFNSPLIEGLNNNKTEGSMTFQLTKPHSIKNQKPDSLILGSSRAEIAFNPDHPAFKENTYNLAVPASNPYIIKRLFQHAQSNRKIKTVVLSLDFYMFNLNKTTVDIIYGRTFENRLDRTNSGNEFISWPQYLKDKTNTLISWHGLLLSKKTWENQEKLASGSFEGFITHKNGFWIRQLPNDYNYRKNFNLTTAAYLSKVWFEGERREYQLDTIEGDHQGPFFYLRQLLNELYKNKVETTIVILPIHVKLLETLAAAELWNDLENWKRRLVTTVEQEASTRNKKPYVVWDFNDYNIVNLEPIPQPTTQMQKMQWYIDPSHLTEKGGNIILGNIFKQSPTKETRELIDIGNTVSSENIEKHLENIRQQQELYRKNSPKYFKDGQQLSKAIRDKNL